MSQVDEVSLTLAEGWHCSHFYYRFKRTALADLTNSDRQAVRESFIAALADEDETPERLQLCWTSGHKADFGVMVLDPHPAKVDAVHQRLQDGPLGNVIHPVYSYVSLTEVSEYVPSVEQYGLRLVAEGETAGSPAYEAKIKAYAARETAMRRQRLTPDMPAWPATCFYPMNKWRVPGANWFSLPFSERNRLMAEHGRTGMTFGGRVTQLITVGIGLDDWEWGVTLWAKNPAFLKEIVYKMRFDEASAKYAEFGPFYAGYVAAPAEVLKHCRV